MPEAETTLTIARVRRAMPRNPDVMLICDELEKAMRQQSLPLECPVCVERRATKAKAQSNWRKGKKVK
jgi:hypothetical protein